MNAEKIAFALLQVAGVTNLVGTRIYFDARPEEDPLPAIVYTVVDEIDDLPIDATPGSIPATARIQVSGLAATAEQRSQLAEQIALAGDRKSGTIAGITVTAVMIDRGPTGYDALVDTYYQSVDYLIHFQR